MDFESAGGFSTIREVLNIMKVYALVGESGTGKSYNAIRLAAQYKLDYIIDDGILICKNKVIAGISAKKAPTIIDATFRAIFEDDVHREQVKKAIEELCPKGMLVLATSIKMAEKIRTRLTLPEFEEIIRIEDISSSEDIAKARLIRKSQGKHVIPVPAMEIRKTFSGYFLDPLRVFRKNSPRDLCEDKSIVRPSYSYLGEFMINDTVLCALASYEASKCDGVDRITRISVDKSNSNVVFNVEVIMNYGADIRKCSEQIITCIKEAMEKYAAIYTDYVNLTVKSLNIS